MSTNVNYLSVTGPLYCIRCDYKTDTDYSCKEQERVFVRHLELSHPNWRTDEVPLLKRAQEAARTCTVCGGAQVLIRGRYPDLDKRLTCPRCVTERLDQIRDIASPDYGVACEGKAAKAHQRQPGPTTQGD